ncbi:MAG TPA: serine/threonine-protein kinase [Polyangiaceae bacterium]|jgi:serine/threonine protein kinase
MRPRYGSFQIVKLVASTDMANVFLARHVETGERVALKVLTGDYDRSRFEREARMLATTIHPNVVRYVGHGITPRDDAWIAMEWLEGEDLGTRLESGPLSLGEVLAVARGLGAALAHIHARGLVHRDVKPGNIFLQGGDVSCVRLLDFGIARDGADPGLTGAYVVMGTPSTMPPEQALDARKADARADVFSFGAVLFHALTGRPLYTAAAPEQIFAQIVLARAPRLSELVPFVPQELDELVARALSRDPAARHPNAGALLAALANVRASSYFEDESVTRIRAAPVIACATG